VCQIEFTECKHTGIELMQWPSKVPIECPVDYKVMLTESQNCYTLYTMRIEYF